MVFSAPANHNFSWKMTVVGIDRWEHVRGTQWPRRTPWTVKRFRPRQFDWEVAVNRQNNEWRHFQVQCKGGLSRRGVGGSRGKAEEGDWIIDAETDSAYFSLPSYGRVSDHKEITLSAFDGGGQPVMSAWTIQPDEGVTVLTAMSGTEIRFLCSKFKREGDGHHQLWVKAEQQDDSGLVDYSQVEIAPGLSVRPLGTADGLHIIEVLRSKLGDGEFHSWYLERTDAGPHQGEVLWVEPCFIGHMGGDPRSVTTLIKDGVLAPGEYRYLGQVHSHPSDDVPSGRDLDIMLLYNIAVARDNPGSDDYYVVTGSRIFQYRPGENYWLVSEDL